MTGTLVRSPNRRANVVLPLPAGPKRTMRVIRAKLTRRKIPVKGDTGVTIGYCQPEGMLGLRHEGL
jgi:hypothetical protein